MRRSVLILASIFFSTVLWAQPMSQVSLESQLEAANKSYDERDYYNALVAFEAAYKEQKDKGMALDIASLHYRLRDYKKAVSWYKRVLRRDKDNLYFEDRYGYGMALKAMGDYEAASAELLSFIDQTENEELKKRAQLALEGIDISRGLEDNLDAVISFGGKKLNMGSTENSPRYYDDGALYFSALNTNKIIENPDDDEEAYAKIYYATKGEKDFSKPTALGEHINRRYFHNTNPSFSADGRKMYFTRQTLENDQLTVSELYVSNRSGDDWLAPERIDELNGDFIVKHPASGELFGKEVLFFSSDQHGGKGKFDLYYATVSGDGFEVPVNLGDQINTNLDEITPFYIDGKLYFSSDGHPGLGGYDIYEVTWTGSGWSELRNMGHGYNSTVDDMSLSFMPGQKKGVLISNRPDKKKRNNKSKTCCDDIYTVEIQDIVIELFALTKDDKDEDLIGCEVTLKDLAGAAEDKFNANSLANDFHFLLQGDHSYQAIAKKDGYFPDTVEFNTAGIIDNYMVKKTFNLTPIPAEPDFEVVTTDQPIRLNNIYYDFDDDKILPDAEGDLNELLKLMNQYPEMVIELSSHTDAQGVSSYNEKLSQRRADSAKRYMVERGIADERIQAVGYGESQILNHCVNGKRCSDEEHRFNRRTEFSILEGPKTIQIKKEVLKGVKKN